MSVEALSAIATSPGAGFSMDEPAWRMLVYEQGGKVREPLALSILGGTAVFGDTSLSPRMSLHAGLAIVGLSDPEIARGLGVTEHTVGTHLGNVFHTLGVSNRSALADACFNIDNPVLTMRENAGAQQLDGLSYMDRTVALLVTSGASNRDIASRLDVRPATIGKRISRVSEKVGVTGRTALASLLVFAGQTGVEADPQAADALLTKRITRVLSNDKQRNGKLAVLRGRFSQNDD